VTAINGFVVETGFDSPVSILSAVEISLDSIVSGLFWLRIVTSGIDLGVFLCNVIKIIPIIKPINRQNIPNFM